MLQKLTLFLLVLTLHLVAVCQNCTAGFVDATTMSGTGFVETCSLTGQDNYVITVNPASDSTLAFNGLYREPVTIIADIDCNAQTFTIAAQPIFSGHYTTGTGSRNGQSITIVYTIHQANDSSAIETCTGFYSVSAVGLTAQTDGPRPYLYPNPAREQAVLRISGMNADATAATYRVLDLKGREVMNGALDANSMAIIDVREMTKGVYTVLVQDGEGQFASKLLVVQ
jgi:hypothetical protein